MAESTMSLRALFRVISLGAAVYFVAIAVYLQFGLLPTTSELSRDAEALLDANNAIQARTDELEAAVLRPELLMRGRPVDVPLPADSAARIIAATDAILANGLAARLEAQLNDPSESVRVSLQEASEAEDAIRRHAVEALQALADGDRARAVASVLEADHARERTVAAFSRVRALSIEMALERERALEEATVTALQVLGAWGLVGTVLVAWAFVVLRRRVYLPLESLEGSLARVARGDLDATADETGADELGKLGAMFNEMAGVLRQREREATTTRQTIVERYGRILEESASELVAIDVATLGVLEANRSVLDHLGYGEDELTTLTAHDLWIVDEKFLRATLSSLAEGERERASFLAEQRRRDGSTYPAEVTLYRAPDHDPPAFMAVVHDLTERIRREEMHEQLARFALDKSEILQSGDTDLAAQAITEMATQTLDVQRAGIWLFEEDGIRCVDQYDGAAAEHEEGVFLRRSDYPSYFEALATERTIDAVNARTDERTREFTESYLEPHGIMAMLDAPVRVGGRMLGVVCHEHVGGPRVWTPEEQVLAAAVADFVTQVLEVGERRRAEEAMRRSEARYRAVFEQAAAGIAEVDLKGRFFRVNPRFEQMLGYPAGELITLKLPSLMHAEDRATFESEIEALIDGRRTSVQLEMRLLRRDGSELWAEISVARVREADDSLSHLIVVATDVSEARDLHGQLIHAQRMDSIGRLAGGIAHDFNNLLTAILGHAELGAATVREDDPVYEDLREIEESALRASSLTRQLLTFARRQVTEPKTVVLDELTGRAERLLRRLIGEDVELLTDLRAEGAAVRIDPGQYEQVIVNIAVNARDAMPGGGVIKIASRAVVIDPRAQSSVVDLPPGTYVELTVEDSGTGMAPEVQKRIFEPFFTTKPPGEGTGLGLATCYGIVGQAGGGIRVSSEPGRGSTFTVLLPVVGELTDAGTESDQETDLGRGKETVLVAEDEEAVRRLVVESLRRKGYEVLPAADGAEALEVAEGFDGTIDVLVTDIVMPKMRGPELASRVRSERPTIKVLFMSGYSGSADTEEALTTADSVFLSKPFTPTQLTARVRELLDGPVG